MVDAFSVNRRENYVYSTAGDTTGHGGDVFETIGYFAPDAEYNLYRIIAENGRTRRGDLVQAIADASYHGLDFLNVSVGIAHHEENDYDCGGHCRVADETRLAIEEGLTVVGATGNRRRDDPLAVNCPARVDDTIGVGGFVSHCRSDLIESDTSGQYWVRNGDLQGPFCGQQGCSPDRSCTEHRYEKPWSGNVAFRNAIPDVLAPVHHPVVSQGTPLLQSGTSFAAPIVCGILAAIAGDLLELGLSPTPAEFQTAVTQGATELDEGELGKFQAGGTWDFLQDI